MRLIFVAAFLSCLFAAEAHASVNVVVNGSTYVIPQKNEKGWGDNVTTWIQAISGATLQPNGGTFTLTSDTYFGANFGLVSQYYKSPTTNIASTGILRLAKSDSIAFRNNANSSDLLLGINASDQLTFTGGIVATSSAGTFSDSGFAVYNNADNTKKLAIDASAITTGTTRTLKMANAAVDLANLNASTITSGTLPTAQLPATIPAGNLPVIPIANGGTNNGSLSVAAGAVPYFDGTKFMTLAPGSSGNVLTSGGAGAPTWSSPLVNPMTTLGDTLYGGAAGAVTRLAGDTSNARKFLRTLSAAGVAAAPAWDTILGSDVSGAVASATKATNIAGGLGGSIPYQSAVDTTVLLANGTSGFKLTSNGGTSAPTWAEDSVISHATNGTTYNTENIERAQLSGVCAITLQSGTWITGTSQPAAGRCQITIAAGIFSGTPSCVCTGRASGIGSECGSDSSATLSNTTWNFVTASATGTNTSQVIDIICMGPK